MIARIHQTFWPRFWAGWIDAAVLAPFGFLDVWVWEASLPTPVVILWFVLSSLSWLLYSILLHGYRGQTLGKYLMGVRVVDVGGGALSFRQAVIRDSIWLVATLVEVAILLPTVASDVNLYDPDVPLPRLSNALMAVSVGWMFLEFGTMLLNAQRRAIHDLIAGSVVIRVRGVEAKPVVSVGS